MLTEMNKIRAHALRFVGSCKGERIGEYKYSLSGGSNLYSSCYALMSRHYLDDLKLSEVERLGWAEYLNQWQNPDGSYLGPELLAQFPAGAKHDLEHLTLHLAVTVLPCLALLSAEPKYPLKFAYKFLDSDFLVDWLNRRDWADAWLEGNNLLFVMQVLQHLRDVERIDDADRALTSVFDWLDGQTDEKTGLWGTNGFCSNFVAMCGGYHQLLIYYAEGRRIQFPRSLVDTTLALQHPDGGFSPGGGGGACEDVDAVDILVNLYKRQDYRRPEIRVALRKAFRALLRVRASDGGFLYRLGEEFTHMGMELTRTPANASTLFATWFRLHTIALIAEVLLPGGASRAVWRFNNVPSMGWHDVSIPIVSSNQTLVDRFEEVRAIGAYRYIKDVVGYDRLQRIKRLKRKIIG